MGHLPIAPHHTKERQSAASGSQQGTHHVPALTIFAVVFRYGRDSLMSKFVVDVGGRRVSIGGLAYRHDAGMRRSGAVPPWNPAKILAAHYAIKSEGSPCAIRGQTVLGSSWGCSWCKSSSIRLCWEPSCYPSR